MLECSTRIQACGLLQLSCKCTLNHDHTLYRLHLQIFYRKNQHLREDSSQTKTSHKIYPPEILQRSTFDPTPDDPSQYAPHEMHDTNLHSGMMTTHIRTRSDCIIRPPTRVSEFEHLFIFLIFPVSFSQLFIKRGM